MTRSITKRIDVITNIQNLHEKSFDEAWRSQVSRALRAAHLTKDLNGTVCESCVAYA